MGILSFFQLLIFKQLKFVTGSPNVNAVSWWSKEERLAVTSSHEGGPALAEPLYHNVSVGAFLASTSAPWWRMLEINVTVQAVSEGYIAFPMKWDFSGLLMNENIFSLYTVMCYFVPVNHGDCVSKLKKKK